MSFRCAANYFLMSFPSFARSSLAGDPRAIRRTEPDLSSQSAIESLPLRGAKSGDYAWRWRLNIACVRETAVPPGPDAVSRIASSCLVNAFTRLVPSPGLAELALTSGLPTPLSETVNFQSLPETS
jgi:hypothetical protein